jgi:hypothetical protein
VNGSVDTVIALTACHDAVLCSDDVATWKKINFFFGFRILRNQLWVSPHSTLRGQFERISHCEGPTRPSYGTALANGIGIGNLVTEQTET